MSVLDSVRAEVCALHSHLTRWNLVTWTAGNVSARVPGEDLLVIKQSGVEYDSLTPSSMVVLTRPGTDTFGLTLAGAADDTPSGSYRLEVTGFVRAFDDLPNLRKVRRKDGCEAGALRKIRRLPELSRVQEHKAA